MRATEIVRRQLAIVADDAGLGPAGSAIATLDRRRGEQVLARAAIVGFCAHPVLFTLTRVL